MDKTIKALHITVLVTVLTLVLVGAVGGSIWLWHHNAYDCKERWNYPEIPETPNGYICYKTTK